jgi:hypothetical protein
MDQHMPGLADVEERGGEGGKEGEGVVAAEAAAVAVGRRTVVLVDEEGSVGAAQVQADVRGELVSSLAGRSVHVWAPTAADISSHRTNCGRVCARAPTGRAPWPQGDGGGVGAGEEEAGGLSAEQRRAIIEKWEREQASWEAREAAEASRLMESVEVRLESKV